MKGNIIIDTGPLVALLNRRERYHPWIRETVGSLATPFLTCESVIAEACFFLSRVHGGEDAVLKLMESGNLTIPFQLDAEVTEVRELIQRYRSVPMSLADACLVRMAELIPGSSVLTLDSDFFVYRKHRKDAIAAIVPEDLSL